MRTNNAAFLFVGRTILHLVISFFLALGSIIAMEKLGKYMVQYDVNGLLREMVFLVRDRFSSTTLLFGLVLFYFLILQLFMFRYIDRLSKELQGVAVGRLDLTHQLSVRRGHPAKSLAINMNDLISRLRKSMEEEMQAEMTKNELVTNVSHDLRTPLTSVIGYLGLIEQDRYRDEVELRQYVQVAYEKSLRLNVLINDLFEYTRMRHDQASLKLEAVDIGELLGQLLAQHYLQLEERGMKGELFVQEKGLLVKGDVSKLVRIFENLITNAMNYGKDGKRLDLTVKRVEQRVVIGVINFGDPISPMDLPYLFDRFYRADKSRTEWAGGSGLGLAISKGLVLRHDGRIWVESSEEQTAFFVELPLLELK